MTFKTLRKTQILWCVWAAFVGLGFLLLYNVPKGNYPLFDGKACKVQHRLGDIKCGQRKFSLHKVHLRNGANIEHLKPGDSLNCSRLEGGEAECDLVIEAPT